MKYIKSFNESIESKEEIEELSQLCFANLLDEDFKVTLDGIELYPLTDLDIYISRNLKRSIDPANFSDSLFYYKDVKDYLIPFLKLLNKSYKIDHILFIGDWKKKSWLDKKIEDFRGSRGGSRERKEVSVEDLVSDKFRLDFKIVSIKIKIKKTWGI
jgi:hypothetical protein